MQHARRGHATVIQDSSLRHATCSYFNANIGDPTLTAKTTLRMTATAPNRHFENATAQTHTRTGVGSLLQQAQAARPGHVLTLLGWLLFSVVPSALLGCGDNASLPPALQEQLSNGSGDLAWLERPCVDGAVETCSIMLG